MQSHDEIVRRYGPWAPLTPRDAARLLADYPGRWWIAGGWAIDAATGTSRPHGDLDIGIPREDLDAFVAFAAGRWDVWAAATSLTPLGPGFDLPVPPHCGNLWLRPDGASPWELDVLLDAVTGPLWRYQRDRSITRPFAACVEVHDGITHLRPEVQLLLKSRHLREKDTADLRRSLPHLTEADVRWLAASLGATDPGHPWLALLDEGSDAGA